MKFHQNNLAGGWASIGVAAAMTATISSPINYKWGGNMAQQPPKPPLGSEGTRFQDERLFDAKIAASEARTDTKFERLIGKIEALSGNITAVSAKIDVVDAHARSTKTTIIATILASAIGIVGLPYAAVAIFGSGMGITAMAYQSGMAAAQAASSSASATPRTSPTTPAPSASRTK